MFGASEDRARQLAYRKRRERIVSGNSCSMLRSFSTSSHTSQQSHASFTQNRSVSQSVAPGEHAPLPVECIRGDVSRPASGTRSLYTNLDPTLAVNPNPSHLDRHSSQAEYLSQVLYDSVSIGPTPGTSVSNSVTSAKIGSDGILGPSLAFRRHARNLTAPVACTATPSQMASIEAYRLDPPLLLRSSHEATDLSLRAQTTVFLRGGGDAFNGWDPDRAMPTTEDAQNTFAPPIQQLQSANGHAGTPGTVWDLSRPFMLLYPWAQPHYCQPPWFVPISTGPAYDAFVSSLTNRIIPGFFDLFGVSKPPAPYTSPIASSRRLTYQRMGSVSKTWLYTLIDARKQELSVVAAGGADPQLSPRQHYQPGLMLFHLMEATEDEPLRAPSSSMSYNPTLFANQNIYGTQSPGSYQTPFSYDQTPSSTQIPLSYQSLLSNQIRNNKPVPLSPLDGTRVRPDMISMTYDQRSRDALQRTKMQSLVSGRRSTSAPNLEDQHSGPQQQRYFSGGGGSTGSPAIKTILSKVFDHYRENPSTEPDMVGAEGTMQYCSDIKVDLEGLDSLAVHEIVQAPAMAEMSREGFISGWQERNCETVEKQKAYIKNIKAELPDNRELFERIYKYAFTIAKTTNSRQAALEQAIEFWKLLFGSPLSPVKWKSANTPWLDWWEEFLTTSFKKSINKDMWNETLKFAKLTLADDAMSFWTEESSWPSVIDDFVEWVKTEKRGGGKAEAMDEDY